MKIKRLLSMIMVVAMVLSSVMVVGVSANDESKQSLIDEAFCTTLNQYLQTISYNS